jgi:hypothetical protein
MFSEWDLEPFVSKEAYPIVRFAIALHICAEIKAVLESNKQK